MKEHEKKYHDADSERGTGVSKIGNLRFNLILFVFLMLTVSGILSAALILSLRLFHAWPLLLLNPTTMIITTMIASVIIGTCLSALFSKKFLHPLRELRYGTNEIARGNFSVRLGEPTEDWNGEIAELVRSFNQMAEELDGVEVFRNDFINNFSHEFKTPIVSVRGFARQLQAGGLTPEQEKEYIDIIVRESDRLSKMTANVLLLTKLENQQIVTGKTEFFLDEQIREGILLLERSWEKKNIRLEVDLDEVRYYFDAEMLSQVWINLLGNAIKFTPESGSISVKLRSAPDAVTVTISDTGCGMDEETRAHIFDKFYQGDRSHAMEGNGIGLTLVSRILSLCGGSVRVESKPGKGSAFHVTLPPSAPPAEPLPAEVAEE